MKKKILVFLVFAGFLLAGGLKVNFAEAINEVGKCGTAAGKNYDANIDILPSGDTLCANGYTHYDSSGYGFYFPTVGGSASWQCSQNGTGNNWTAPTLFSCNMSRKYYVCPSFDSIKSAHPTAKKCSEQYGGDDENFITSPVNSWTDVTNRTGDCSDAKCEYFIPAAPIKYCGSFDGRTFTTETVWPSNSDGNGFCQNGYVLSGVTPEFPNSNKPTTDWICNYTIANIYGMGPVSCTATKTVSASTTNCDLTDHHLEGNNCVVNSKLMPCGIASLKTGEMWNDGDQQNGTYNQTWSASSSTWSETKSKTFSTAVGECNFKCTDDYRWNSSACVLTAVDNGATTSVAPVIRSFFAPSPIVESGADFSLKYFVTGDVAVCRINGASVVVSSGISENLGYSVENEGNIEIEQPYVLRCVSSTGTIVESTVKVTIKPKIPTGNIPPTAKIDITKTQTTNTDKTDFTGTGTDTDGSIVEYKWFSGLSCAGTMIAKGFNSTVGITNPQSMNFSENTTIWFKVMDNANNWSTCVSEEVAVPAGIKLPCLGSYVSETWNTEKCPASKDELALIPGSSWVNAWENGCDPNKSCQYITTTAKDTTTDDLSSISAPTNFSATCNSSGLVTVTWSSVTGADRYALRIDTDTQPAAAPPFHPLTEDNISKTTTSYTWQGEIGKTYYYWMHAVKENGENDFWTKTQDPVPTVVCSSDADDNDDNDDSNELDEEENVDTTPDVVDLGLCGPAGSFDKTQPKTYDWSVSEFTEKLCVNGESNPINVVLKMGRRVNWICYDEAKTTSQKCYARRNSNGNIDTTPDEEEESTALTCGGAVPENANLCAGDDTGLTSATNNSILVPGKSCGTKKCEYTCNTGFRKKGKICVADDNNTTNNSDPKCGTANKKFYEVTDVDFGEDTLCAKGIASPLEPVFPDEGKIVEWKCSESGNWITDTILPRKVAFCAAARKNSEITAGCGDASGSYSGTAMNFRSTNFCASGLNLSSGTPIFPTIVGGSTDWVCRPSLLGTIFTNKKPVVCSATKGSQSSTPDTDTTPTPTPTPTPTEEVASIGNGDGLLGEYFDNIDFTAKKVTQINPTINFDWGDGRPVGALESDTFSVRWTGKVQPRYTGSWNFHVTGDDGIRLWVNDQIVVDGWIEQRPTEHTGMISLTAGQKYNIKMEYYENKGGAVAKLAWSNAKQSKEIIPQTQLYSN
ncbi:MAG: PA14 domain-containing protein [bacterium]|nr:PA14 domain-containing protein [bacterium]